MNKRITSIVLSFVMLFTMLATAVPVLAAGSTSFKMTADKTEAHPGDIITYTVTMGAVTNLDSLKIKLDIPAGLTFVTGSGKITEGLATTMNVDGAEFTESTMVILIGNAKAQDGYTSTLDTEIMKFQCKVDADASGNKTVNFIIDEDEVFEAPSGGYDNIAFTTSVATVNVTTPHVHVYNKEVATKGYLKTGATCTEAAVYYKSCECGAKGTETFTSGSALGHDYTKKVENNTYLKTAASNCTKYNVYWYACSRCDANAKDDAAATDKYYTSTTAGNHSFTEKIEDASHYVADTGTNCQSVKQYYYDCAYCDQIGTTTWDSTTYGAHTEGTEWKFDENKHWHICTVEGCGVVIESSKEAHTPDHTGHATEEYAIKCTKCGYVIEAQLDHTHVFDKEVATDVYKATDATCMAKATYYKSCACGAKGTTTFEYGELGAHNWTPATCTVPKTCSVCQATEGDPLGHTEGNEWKYDSDNHWHTCTVEGCGVVIESSKEAHTPDRAEATVNDPIKCSVCGYEIEAQLVAVTNIAATITAPVLGATPDYTPTYVSTPSGGVQFGEVTWYKIKKEDYTGTYEDNWTEMASDETFTTEYYYSADMFFRPEDGYGISEDVTGTVNGKAHVDTYGSVYGEDPNGGDYAYLCIEFGPLHDADTEHFESDADNHWNNCANCDEKQNIAPHAFEWIIDKEATATEKGSKHEECTVCGYAKASVDIPATGTEKTENPDTGDANNMLLWGALLLAGGLGVTGTAAYSKKRREDAE